jgi:hypothetical protein
MLPDSVPILAVSLQEIIHDHHFFRSEIVKTIQTKISVDCDIEKTAMVPGQTIQEYLWCYLLIHAIAIVDFIIAGLAFQF